METNDNHYLTALKSKLITITMESKEVINMAKQITIEDLWNQ